MADPKLIIQILGELDGLTTSLKEGESQLDTWADKAASVGKALTTVAVGAGLVALGKQIFDVTAATARQAEVTEQLSQQTGIAAQTFERWSVPLARVGLTGQDVALGMRQLSRNIVEAKDGSSGAAQAFARLGVDLSTIGDSESAIKAIADQFQALPDGIEKAALAQQLFGLSGARLIPILNQGSAGIEAMTKQSEAFGLVLSEAQRTSLTQFDDALDDLSMAARGFGTQIGAAFAPALDWLTRVATVATTLATQTFGKLVETATTLTARFVGLARATAEIASTLLSFNVFSAEAWKQTMELVMAIDQETAATIAAIRAGERLIEVTTQTVTVTDAAGAAQERLGLKIRDAALAMLQQSAAAGKAEEAIGAFIVMQTQAQNVLDAATQEGLGRAIVANEQAAQKNAQAWIDSYQAQEDAALARVDVEIVAQDKAQEALGASLVRQTQAALQVGDFWTQTLKSIQDGFAFVWGQITLQVSHALAQQLVMGNDWAKTLQSLSISVLQGFITMGIQILTHWVATEAAKTAVSVAADATRTASTVAAATTSTAAVTASVAAQTGVMAAFATSAIAMLMAVWTVAKAVLASIAAAMKATIFGIPVGLAITAALIAGAILVASASKEAAALLGAAAAGTAAITFLAHGAIVTGPTLTMLGEAGPEAVVPLTRRGMGFGEQTIIVPVQLDGREIARSIARHMGRGFSGYGAPAIP